MAPINQGVVKVTFGTAMALFIFTNLLDVLAGSYKAVIMQGETFSIKKFALGIATKLSNIFFVAQMWVYGILTGEDGSVLATAYLTVMTLKSVSDVVKKQGELFNRTGGAE